MRDQWKPWVWAVFAFNCLFATVFALLCWESYRQFRNVTKSSAFAPALTDVKEWYIQQVALRYAERHFDLNTLLPRRTALFNGAASSAFFAVILVIIFTVRTNLTTGMSSVMSTCHVDMNSSTGRHMGTSVGMLLLAGLCHILHDIHTKGAVSPRLTLRKGFHGCTDLHVCSSYLQYCHTRKHIYTPLLTLA